jgi:hypothetical protein
MSRGFHWFSHACVRSRVPGRAAAANGDLDFLDRGELPIRPITAHVEVRCIFTRVDTMARLLDTSCRRQRKRIFSAMIEMLCVLAILLVTAIGTTAPFSAMSGAVIVMSLLSIMFAAPRLLSASTTAFDEKAPSLRVAAPASPLLRTPAAVAASKAVALPVILSSVLRQPFIPGLLAPLQSDAAAARRTCHLVHAQPTGRWQC